ncbi:BED zinc finger,hAT family dimerization domain [Hibiscus syriacus]|uniref:BED zinc finger,hAT family dimerization domain n=1 Tax=Hibiscus syriacus TaxID=106335 RepID=A0A6A3D952_HIBSY|nr:BED zinc finger,hAT family dimerization domain [Hibiscus syriacus]
MDVRKIVVVVEDIEVSRTALRWSLHNLLRYGDLLTLLHVFSATKSMSKKKARMLRLKGYQLALSFKEICNSNFFNTNIEMIVTEGDQEGRKIVAMVREIGASSLVVGLHRPAGVKWRFIGRFKTVIRLALAHYDNIANSLSCRVLAIKQPELTPLRGKTREMLPPLDGSTTLDFSQIEISGLQ